MSDDRDPKENQVLLHLRDVHALEEQSKKQLERAVGLCSDDEVKKIYEEHLEQSTEHEEKVRERIEAHDEKPSAVRDLTMRSGEIGIRQLADIAPDTPVKLAMHFYAFEHLEIAAYDLLCRIAKEAGADETASMAEEILEQEREAAEKVEGTFERSVELMFEQQEQAEDRDEDEAEREEEPSRAGA